ncbi:MAG: cation transporter [Candidatus Heimdallarchaeota archaeon]
MTQAKVEEVLRVEEMYCTSCAETVKKAISKLPGVSRVRVNSLTSRAVVEFDSTRIHLDKLVYTVEKLGYRVEIRKPLVTEVTLGIPGMDRASSGATIKKTLLGIAGVAWVVVSPAISRAKVLLDPFQVAISELIDAIEQVGYSAEDLREKDMVEGL